MYEEATVLIAKRVTGEEEVPEGVVAVLTPDAPDVLSHVSVRARNMKVRSSTYPPCIYSSKNDIPFLRFYYHTLQWLQWPRLSICISLSLHCPLLVLILVQVLVHELLVAASACFGLVVSTQPPTKRLASFVDLQGRNRSLFTGEDTEDTLLAAP